MPGSRPRWHCWKPTWWRWKRYFRPTCSRESRPSTRRSRPTTSGLCPAARESRPYSCSTAYPGGPPTRENREHLRQAAVSSAAIESETPPNSCGCTCRPARAPWPSRQALDQQEVAGASSCWQKRASTTVPVAWSTAISSVNGGAWSPNHG